MPVAIEKGLGCFLCTLACLNNTNIFAFSEDPPYHSSSTRRYLSIFFVFLASKLLERRICTPNLSG